MESIKHPLKFLELHGRKLSTIYRIHHKPNQTKPNKVKTVRQHKAVAKYDTGWNQDSDYKHYCELSEGWVFGRGRMEGCSSLFFNTLADFKYADPMTKADYAKQEAAR